MKLIVSTTDGDDCAGVSCANNGTCVDGEFDYTCVGCTGFTGKDCDVGEWKVC